MRRVAQSVRVAACEAVGCGFESRPSSSTAERPGRGVPLAWEQNEHGGGPGLPGAGETPSQLGALAQSDRASRCQREGRGIVAPVPLSHNPQVHGEVRTPLKGRGNSPT